jgi:GNAT superfamily N-acetyltransferase
VDIVRQDAPPDEVREAIFQPLRAENRRRMPRLNDARTVAYCLKDDTETIIGGLWAQLLFDWVYLDLLFVPHEQQRNGIGRELMDRLAQFAEENDATGIWLETFAFQARGFYEKCGYEVFATLKGRDPGTDQYLMRRFVGR